MCHIYDDNDDDVDDDDDGDDDDGETACSQVIAIAYIVHGSTRPVR